MKKKIPVGLFRRLCESLSCFMPVILTILLACSVQATYSIKYEPLEDTYVRCNSNPGWTIPTNNTVSLYVGNFTSGTLTRTYLKYEVNHSGMYTLTCFSTVTPYGATHPVPTLYYLPASYEEFYEGNTTFVNQPCNSSCADMSGNTLAGMRYAPNGCPALEPLGDMGLGKYYQGVNSFDNYTRNVYMNAHTTYQYILAGVTEPSGGLQCVGVYSKEEPTYSPCILSIAGCQYPSDCAGVEGGEFCNQDENYCQENNLEIFQHELYGNIGGERHYAVYYRNTSVINGSGLRSYLYRRTDGEEDWSYVTYESYPMQTQPYGIMFDSDINMSKNYQYYVEVKDNSSFLYQLGQSNAYAISSSYAPPGGSVYSVLDVTVKNSNDTTPINGAQVNLYKCPVDGPPLPYWEVFGISGCVFKAQKSTNASGRAVFPAAYYAPDGWGDAWILVQVVKSGYSTITDQAYIFPNITKVYYYMSGGGLGSSYLIYFNISSYSGVRLNEVVLRTRAYIGGIQYQINGESNASGMVVLSYPGMPVSLTLNASKAGFNDFYYITSTVKDYYPIVMSPTSYPENETFNISGYVLYNNTPLKNHLIIADCMLLTGWFESKRFYAYADENGLYSFALPVSICDIYPEASPYDFEPESYDSYDVEGNDDTLNFTASYAFRGYQISIFVYKKEYLGLVKTGINGVQVQLNGITNTSYHENTYYTDTQGFVYYVLPSGKYNISLSKTGYATLDNQVITVSASLREFEFEMITGENRGAISVRIYKKTGTTKEACTGFLKLKDENKNTLTNTPFVSSYIFSNLEEGTYYIYGETTEGGTAEISVKVIAGETQYVDLVIDTLVSRIKNAFYSFVEVVIAIAGGLGFIAFLLFFAVVMILFYVISHPGGK